MRDRLVPKHDDAVMQGLFDCVLKFRKLAIQSTICRRIGTLFISQKWSCVVNDRGDQQSFMLARSNVMLTRRDDKFSGAIEVMPR
jgi:hypothetical protein